jgi:hypothetical protein
MNSIHQKTNFENLLEKKKLKKKLKEESVTNGNAAIANRINGFVKKRYLFTSLKALPMVTLLKADGRRNPRMATA